MFTPEEREKLKEMHACFERIEAIFLDFSPETRDKIAEYHNETGSIPHCYRWGLQGTGELIDER